MENVKVVILAGGLGTRLREETEFRPKPMVPIGGKPMLWHIMKIYSHYGFKDFVVCLGYKGDLIKEYFLAYRMLNSDFTIDFSNCNQLITHESYDETNWRVTLAETGAGANTGARVKKIEKYIDSDYFMLTYGDGVADIDLQKLLCCHKASGKLATVTGVRPPSRFGELITDGNRVVQFSEKPQIGNGLVSGGFFVFNSEALKYFEQDDRCVLEKGPMGELTKAGELGVYTHDGFWQCMDTLRDVNLLNELWETGHAPWKVWD